ncbi:MAG: MATE family efflux transporter, partial [Pseudomonadota bacterium]
MATFNDHLRATLRLGLPLIGGMVAQAAISLTDTIMVGWYGVTELAAVALGGAYFHVILILGMGFGLAVMPLVASAAASDDRRQVRRVTRMGLWLGLIFSVLVMPVFWFSGTILEALGQAPEVVEFGSLYLRIAGWGIGPAVLITIFRSHLSALEHAPVVLYATCAGVLLNAGLNWLLIFGNLGLPELGVAGAAIASVATNALICLILALYAGLQRQLRDYDLFSRFWRADWEAFGEVFRLGWPISLTLLSESGLFVGTKIMMGWLGSNELAAHGIAIQIASITFMVHIGLSQAVTVRVGQAWGRSDAVGLRLASGAALVWSAVMVALTVAAFV